MCAGSPLYEKWPREFVLGYVGRFGLYGRDCGMIV